MVKRLKIGQSAAVMSKTLEFNDYRTTTVIEKYDTNVASRVGI